MKTAYPFLLVLLLIAPLLLLPAGCSENSLLNSAQAGTPAASSEAPAVPVAVAPAQCGPMTKHYFATATLEANKEAEVVARVSGVVLDLAAEEGDIVEPKDILLRIEEEAYLHRLEQARAEETKQRTRFERQKKMIESELVSAEEFDGIHSDLMAAEASRKLAELELSHARVQPPFAGHIVRRSVDPGRMVTDGTSLFTVADLSRLLARVHVPAKEFSNIRVGQPVNLTLDSNEEALMGTIILVSPIIDPASGTIKVTVAVDEYPEQTRPGDFAEVRIETNRHLKAVRVPNIAVFTDRGEQIAYVAVEDKAERRVVEVGFQDDQFTEILGGLVEGEAVVVKGQRSLKEGVALKILPAAAASTGKDPLPAAKQVGGASPPAAKQDRDDSPAAKQGEADSTASADHGQEEG